MVGMDRRVEFRNILVELIDLANGLNVGYGECRIWSKESSKMFIDFSLNN